MVLGGGTWKMLKVKEDLNHKSFRTPAICDESFKLGIG
jgi:hypothetical protein